MLNQNTSRTASVSFIIIWIFCAAVWSAGFGTKFVNNPDVYDYAHMGRALLEGRGMVTDQVFPRHIPYLQKKGIFEPGKIPNLYRYPLSVGTSAFFQIFIKNPLAASALQTGFFYLISMILIFLLVRRLASPLIAVAGAAAYAAHPFLHRNSLTGMTEPLAACLLLAALFALFSLREPFRSPVTGVAAGLLYMARYQTAYFSLAFLVCIWFLQKKKRSIRPLLIFILALGITLSPWIFRNISLTGNPLYSFTGDRPLTMNTVSPTFDIETSLDNPIGTVPVLKRYGAVIIRKIKDNLWPEILNPFAWTKDSWAAVMVIIILLSFLPIGRKRSSPEFDLLKGIILGMVFADFLLSCMTLTYQRYHSILFPPLIAIGIREIIMFAKRIAPERRRRTVSSLSLSILIVSALTIFTIDGIKYSRVNSIKPYPPATYTALDRYLEPGNVVAADVSYATALFNRVLSIRLPEDPHELLAISHRYIPVDYVLLGSHIMKFKTRQKRKIQLWDVYQPYRDFIRSDSFLAEYEFTARLPGKALLFKKKNTVFH